MPRHMNQHESRTALIVVRIAVPVSRKCLSVLITVPIWWALWKVCDSLWRMI
jgi:hypothetical protein